MLVEDDGWDKEEVELEDGDDPIVVEPPKKSGPRAPIDVSTDLW